MTTPDEIAARLRNRLEAWLDPLPFDAEAILDDRDRLKQEVERLNRMLATYEAALDREWKEVHDDVDPS
tara:strand:+ start:87 stop:293 length:207 start_codon:yes stop_codon:yes gene_type:complete